MAYFEQLKLLDAQTLYTGVISQANTGPVLDTTNYGNIVVQVNGDTNSGVAVNMTIEGSNDQVEWYTILVNNLNDLAVFDTITGDGGYQFPTSYRYIRYNVANYLGVPTVTFLGRAGSGSSSIESLTAAFNRDTPLQVAFGAGVKQDNYGGLILSDGIPYFMQGNNTFVFNLNGYNTIVLQLSAGYTATCSQSIDGTFFTAAPFCFLTNTTATTTPNSAGIWSGPVVGQYLKIVLTGAVAGQCSILLKNAPLSGAYFNSTYAPVSLSHIAGTATVSGGVAGTLAVGGNLVSGNTPTLLPITVGGTDYLNLTKRFQTDYAGRQLISAVSPYFGTLANNTGQIATNSPVANTQVGINTLGSLPASYQQSAALNVQDTSQFEGKNFTELLAQILLELKILNQQIYELPRLIAEGEESSDPPETFRDEPSMFNV